MSYLKTSKKKICMPVFFFGCTVSVCFFRRMFVSHVCLFLALFLSFTNKAKKCAGRGRIVSAFWVGFHSLRRSFLYFLLLLLLLLLLLFFGLIFLLSHCSPPFHRQPLQGGPANRVCRRHVGRAESPNCVAAMLGEQKVLTVSPPCWESRKS